MAEYLAYALGIEPRLEEAGPLLGEHAHEAILERSMVGGWQLKSTHFDLGMFRATAA